MIQAILHFDFSILRFIQDHLSCPFMDVFMISITRLTDAGFLWIVLSIVLLLIPKQRRTGITLVIALTIGLVLGSAILKPLFARLRPFQLDTAFSLLISAPHDFSFPSGHTLASFSSATVLWCRNKRIGTYAYIFAALVALSRLYLYVHFLTDVLFGIILGILVGFLSNWLMNRLSRKC